MSEIIYPHQIDLFLVSFGLIEKINELVIDIGLVHFFGWWWYVLEIFVRSINCLSSR